MANCDMQISVRFRWWALGAFVALMCWQRVTRREWPRLSDFVCRHCAIISAPVNG